MKNKIYSCLHGLTVFLSLCLFMTGCGSGAGESTKARNLKCTISIRCDTILQNKERLQKGKETFVPEDGVILDTTEVAFAEGASAHDVLQEICLDKKIHMESSWSPLYKSAYVEGINQLYEFDCGELSGWMYKVNGQFPNYGCSKYILKDGDVVDWMYTCDQGKDVGDNSMY